MSLKEQSNSFGEERIIRGNDFYAKKAILTKVKVDNINWSVYYIDNNTKERWVEEYVNSEYHGGGAPQLRLLEKFPWE
jgi:hypothetical protein